MSIYKTVYSPDGEMFEVTQHVFDDVILNLGWTQNPPVKEITKVVEVKVKVKDNERQIEPKSLKPLNKHNKK